MERRENFIKKKRAKKAVIAATAATSLFVNNAYDNPLDIIDDANADNSLEDDDDEKSKSGLKNSFRIWMGKVPLPIRCTILIPLWIIGWFLMLFINPLLDNIIIPNLSLIANWLLAFAIILIIIVIGAKTIFPNLPINNILNKKTFLFALGLTIICGITDKILEINYPNYNQIKAIIKIIGVIIVVTAVITKVYFLNRKTRVKVSTDKFEFVDEA